MTAQEDWTKGKRILRYLKRTIDFALTCGGKGGIGNQSSLNEQMWKVPRLAFVFLPSIAITPLFKNTKCNWPAALSVYDLH
jgi:hypothetical protein